MDNKNKNKVLKKHQGFTIIELLVSMAIVVILAFCATGSVTYWSNNAHLTTANGELHQAFMMARSLAVRNPLGITDSTKASASLVLNASTNTLSVCQGDTNCSTPVWSGVVPSGVSIYLAGNALNCIAMNNSGDWISGATSCFTGSNSYQISTKGGSVNGNL
ncbi:MAG TPA: prepilin-type N-terminal cleavage/methylation domain-containing protein [Anaerovoracaceae bacterium]|nr:prepilin-type N-terminal cleavage/methylation domain-containing protein [Anaerovoracaceae bacterium]